MRLNVFNISILSAMLRYKAEPYLTIFCLCLSFFQTLSVDVSLPEENGQIFWFVSSLQTRFLRIRPLIGLDTKGLKCLRIEVLGCINLGMINMTNTF